MIFIMKLLPNKLLDT